jgi:uncharacterized repeat protein (TIGR03803 family)
MKFRHCHFTFFTFLFASTLALTATASASHEQLLHVFNGTPVKFPVSGLIADPSGNLFGVAAAAVYELSPRVGGGYTYKAIASLGANDFPGGNLARDSAGNLFGATLQGGTNNCGYVYELSSVGGSWTFSVIHTFDSEASAADHTLIFDASGNLYGGTTFGGIFGQGVAYELTPGGGSWSYRVLHDFSTTEGGGPQTGMVFDSLGNLYGGNQAAVFKLTPGTAGTWTESTVYAFQQSTDGFDPLGDLIIDPSGNLYGTNSSAGPFFSGGTAFELFPSGSGWAINVLHAFGQHNGDGSVPVAGLTRDAAGNLYGTTARGGGPNDAGMVFKLSLTTGVWHESVLYRFGGSANNDGNGSVGTLLLKSNTLFGASGTGGNPACNNPNGCGTVFAIR